MTIVPSLSAAKNKTGLPWPDQFSKKLISIGLSHFHLDLTDGSVTPNSDLSLINFGLLENSITYDFHIMSVNPIHIIERIPKSDRAIVHTHFNFLNNINKYFEICKEKGFKIGISLDLDNNINVVAPYLKQIELVNFMSVRKLGMTNVQFEESVFMKIKEFRNKYTDYKKNIMVDGSVRLNHLQELKKYCDYCVVGSILFAGDNFEKNLSIIEKEII
ncbi:beta/alpha barrel domain-containing protein [[Mycoplasma] testudinis]|uniref:hypothetical protein n=1 Tax=[Mycoplasma] testudinis TaxID=33924 RepID=UPI0004810159|nr:hypothetical protein [[Mycoplasma] testudinis]